MGTAKIFALVFSFLILTNTTELQGKNWKNTPPPPMSFVVIGAFVFQKNAKNFTAYAKKLKLEAWYAFNHNRQLYYVYSYSSPIKEKAVEEVYRVREKYKIYDAWVYSGDLEDVQGFATRSVGVERTLTSPKHDLGANQPAFDDDSPPKMNEAVKEMEKTVGADLVEEQKKVEVPIENIIEEEPVSDEIMTEEPTGPVEPDIKEKYKVYVNATNIRKLTEVKGSIELVDNVRQKIITKSRTHELFGLNDPGNGKAAIKCVSRIFGYKPKEVVFSLTNPLPVGSDSVYIFGDSLIVDFGLERLARGDVAVMWNVLFYKDAAIMRPESKAELLSLLDMMKDVPEMKIKLHGHTNGNSHGRVIHLNENDKNFFSLNAQHDEDAGSAKQLSEYRAFTIQHWLMHNGIEESRIEIKGWGGKKMLHPKHDPKAYQNVRVEVEIL